jgi:hypothetical protein
MRANNVGASPNDQAPSLATAVARRHTDVTDGTPPSAPVQFVELLAPRAPSAREHDHRPTASRDGEPVGLPSPTTRATLFMRMKC